METSCKFLGDGAGIYLLGHQPGSVVSGNVVDGVGKGHGFYLDDGSKNVTLSGNVARDAALAPLPGGRVEPGGYPSCALVKGASHFISNLRCCGLRPTPV